MRYRRGVGFEHRHSVLLLQHLRLKAKLIQVLGHALEVYGNRWLLQIVDLLGSDQCELAHQPAITFLARATLTLVLGLKS